ncbi:hypothetical protein QC762_705270 [Podospora pseudocomata]|uniref:Uncharacterized protein n=1 Tax=Podospora pseudocomata TaxID=2093779 RepID=A0ABR0G3H4_9PEZI|nr:hypothetical protein QC762_705270 [Podospora pseudocomata]
MVTDQRSLRSAGARPRHCSQLTCRPSQQLPTYLHDQPIKGVYAYSMQTRRGGPVGIPGSKGRFFGNAVSAVVPRPVCLMLVVVVSTLVGTAPHSLLVSVPTQGKGGSAQRFSTGTLWSRGR